MSCRDLPHHPTPQQLKDAGFIVDLPGVTIAVGIAITLGGLFSFLPQIASILWKRSCHGVSPYFVATSVLANALQGASVIVATCPQIWACSSTDGFGCFANTLPITETFASTIGSFALLVVFLPFWLCKSPCYEEPLLGDGMFSASASHPSSVVTHARDRRIIFNIVFIIPVVVTVASFVLPVIVGPCAPFTGRLRDIIAMLGTIAGVLGPVPQIVMLLQTKDPGALSAVNFVGIVLGGLAMTVSLAADHANPITLLPYIAQIFEGAWVVGMILYYGLWNELVELCGELRHEGLSSIYFKVWEPKSGDHKRDLC